MARMVEVRCKSCVYVDMVELGNDEKFKFSPCPSCGADVLKCEIENDIPEIDPEVGGIENGNAFN